MLQPKVKLEIMRHTQEGFPFEICGVVTQKSRVQKYHRITNVHSDPQNHFEMDASEYAQALDIGELIAVVHSHPGDGCTTLPSVADSAQCNEMGVAWVITSWPEGDMRIVQPESLPLIGRPWSLGYQDCWSLVMAFHKEHGIELNNYSVPYEWWKDGKENIYDDNWQREGFIEVNRDPIYGDMCMFRLQSVVTNHAGIYLGDNQLLHHMSGKLSRKDIFSGWYQDHVVRIVRHKDLPEVLECKISLE